MYDVCACKLVYVYSTYAYSLYIVYTHIPVHIHTVQKIKITCLYIYKLNPIYLYISMFSIDIKI